jgi:hypothetical protein
VKGFEYFVVRCVPRVDREEFLNVGVVLYSQPAGFLAAAFNADRARLANLWPDLDVEAVCAALDTIDAVCRGDRDAGGRAAGGTLTERFGWLAAPRSTVVQPGPVHGGQTDDPPAHLARLLDTLVG